MILCKTLKTEVKINAIFKVIRGTSCYDENFDFFFFTFLEIQNQAKIL